MGRIWFMQLNAMKRSSIVLLIARKRNKQLFQYTFHNQPLEQVNSATYLGVELPQASAGPNTSIKPAIKPIEI